MDEENDMNWKRVISGVLAAALLFALPVQLPVSARRHGGRSGRPMAGRN